MAAFDQTTDLQSHLSSENPAYEHEAIFNNKKLECTIGFSSGTDRYTFTCCLNMCAGCGALRKTCTHDNPQFDNVTWCFISTVRSRKLVLQPRALYLLAECRRQFPLASTLVPLEQLDHSNFKVDGVFFCCCCLA
eukprot:4199186-Amphidinium_carterae.2